MQKTEAQHSQVQNQSAARQGWGIALESPQGEQIAQLEAMDKDSPQTAKLAQLAAVANDSPHAAAQRRMMSTIHNSPRMAAQRKAVEGVHGSLRAAAQRQQIDRLSRETAQREEAKEPLQPEVTQRAEAPTPHHTGLPDHLKNGVEALSGISLDHVKVHYNSSQPMQLNALAYAQGRDIHVAPGQERHLPHEAWHVVQQAQGRVRPTMQMKDGVPVNDDTGLEREADVMGARALTLNVSGHAAPEDKATGNISGAGPQGMQPTAAPGAAVVSAATVSVAAPNGVSPAPASGTVHSGMAHTASAMPAPMIERTEETPEVEAKPENEKASVATLPREGSAAASGAAGTDRKGSADIALGFLNSPPSVIARDIGRLGNSLSSGLDNDAGQLAAATPAVKAGTSTDGIAPPKKMPVPTEVATPPAGVWTPPVAALRSDTPKFTPTGGANPQATETQAAADKAQAAAAGNQLNAEMARMPGEERVQGRNLNATGQVRLTAAKVSIRAESVPEMDEYMNIDMPEGFRREVDAASADTFRQSLAGPRAQIENAKAKRDQDHAAALLSANRQAEELGKKATAEQQQTIAQSREQIGAEKEKSLAESKAVLDEYDGKVSKEKQGKINEINAQIAAHEKQANSALAEADTKVAAEQQKADKQKAEEEKKGEEKKKKRKWYQKIGDFFSGIAKAVAKAVTAIVNTLASVVKSIITAARNLANNIINACTSLVKKLLDTFASIVKGFLNVALAAFPGIRDRLNAAIDKFVSKANAAIDKIADTLRDAVNKLCDTLTQIIEFAQNFMVSTVQGAMLMFQAIITGNFADLPRIAFMTACNSLGLPGEELWAIVLKARDQAKEIIKAPARFLGNLIKAGEKGFGQFVSNIKQHLVNGLMGWLMGQVAQTGIVLPDKFDAAGIFLLIRQVLGVTYEYARERAVSIVGEKNVSRAEAVFTYLKRLFTEPAVLFAELKEKATEMKNTFVEQIEDWAITTVIQKAVIKVTSMLIPGAGFVQAIYGMWQTLQFFLENIKKIAAVVNSLLDSLAEISKGAIGTAANYVEKTMVDTLPLVFAWLAELIGIGGIGQKVKSIIDKLRTPVNKAVDFVINGAMKLGKAAVGKVKGAVSGVKEKVTNWWEERHTFKTKDGADHAVYVEGEGENTNIVVNSPKPKLVKDVLVRFKKLGGLRKVADDAERHVAALSRIVSQEKERRKKTKREGQAALCKLRDNLCMMDDEISKNGQSEDVLPSQNQGVAGEQEAPGYADENVDTEGADFFRGDPMDDEFAERMKNEELPLRDYLIQRGTYYQSNQSGQVAQRKAPYGGCSTNSYKVGLTGKTHTVSYLRDQKGGIDFSDPKSVNPLFGEPIQKDFLATNILHSFNGIEYIDIKPNGMFVYTWEANKQARSLHFRAANLKRGIAGSGQPESGWTWHHQRAPRGEMVPVLTDVHKRHNHNGGVFLW